MTDDDHPFGPDPNPVERCGKYVEHPTKGAGHCEWPKCHDEGEWASSCDPDIYGHLLEEELGGEVVDVRHPIKGIEKRWSFPEPIASDDRERAMRAIIMEELDDGRIRYKSEDGVVTGRQVGTLAVRDTTTSPDLVLPCRACGEPAYEPGGTLFLVDNLVMVERYTTSFTMEGARMYADEFSRNPYTEEMEAWNLAQQHREHHGLHVQSVSEWRSECERCEGTGHLDGCDAREPAHDIGDLVARKPCQGCCPVHRPRGFQADRRAREMLG